MEKQVMKKPWVCIECGEKEIPQYAEYCDECAEKQLSRIGGWLWLPLITLCLSLGGAVYVLYEWFGLYQQYSMFMPSRLMQAMYINLTTTTLLILLILATLLYFFRRSRYLPKLYIIFILTAIIAEIIQEMTLVHLLDEPVNFMLFYPLIRLVIYGMIWISYFRVSERVKKTFIH